MEILVSKTIVESRVMSAETARKNGYNVNCDGDEAGWEITFRDGTKEWITQETMVTKVKCVQLTESEEDKLKGRTIQFIVSNKNKHKVDNVEIFNPNQQEEKKQNGVIVTYVRRPKPDETFYELQDIYKDIKEKKHCIYNHIDVKCSSVQVQPKDDETFNVCKGKMCPYLVDKYIEKTKRYAVAQPIVIKSSNIQPIYGYETEIIYPTNISLSGDEFSRSALIGSTSGIQLDEKSTITISSIPPLTEMIYTICFI